MKRNFILQVGKITGEDCQEWSASIREIMISLLPIHRVMRCHCLELNMLPLYTSLGVADSTFQGQEYLLDFCSSFIEFSFVGQELN